MDVPYFRYWSLMEEWRLQDANKLIAEFKLLKDDYVFPNSADYDVALRNQRETYAEYLRADRAAGQLSFTTTELTHEDDDGNVQTQFDASGNPKLDGDTPVTALSILHKIYSCQLKILPLPLSVLPAAICSVS